MRISTRAKPFGSAEQSPITIDSLVGYTIETINIYYRQNRLEPIQGACYSIKVCAKHTYHRLFALKQNTPVIFYPPPYRKAEIS